MLQATASTVSKSSSPRGVANTDVLEIALDDASRDALGDALERGMPSPYADPERAIPEAVRLFHGHIPSSLLATIERFVVDPGSFSALRLSNLPIDRALPPTPPDGMDVSGKKTFVSEGVLIGLGRLMGHPFAFKEEKRGQLIHQVCPVPKSEHKLSNEGSLTGLGMHVENSFSEFRPHYLLLLCLRGDTEHKAMTRISSGRAIASRLDARHLDVARHAEFRVQCPSSFMTAEGKPMYSEPVAIFDGPDDYLELRIDLPEFTQFLSDRARETFEVIQSVLMQPGVVREIDLQSGDAIVLANRKISHGRTVFTPRYDGTDRWLQRMYTISDPWQMRAHIDERLRVV
jgi:L-asparagine oxygenase